MSSMPSRREGLRRRVLSQFTGQLAAYHIPRTIEASATFLIALNGGKVEQMCQSILVMRPDRAPVELRSVSDLWRVLGKDCVVSKKKRPKGGWCLCGVDFKLTAELAGFSFHPDTGQHSVRIAGSFEMLPRAKFDPTNWSGPPRARPK